MENKIAEINGHRYSRKEFDGYTHRIKMAFEVIGEKHLTYVDIYTTNGVIKNASDAIRSLCTDKVKDCAPVHFCTKEQDDLAAAFID